MVTWLRAWLIRWLMTSKSLLSLVLAFALLPGLVLAEDAKARAAREELERQLQGMMESVPTKVRIDYAEVSDPNYELQEAVFELDGKRLLTPPPGALSMADEKLLVWQGDVSPASTSSRRGSSTRTTSAW